MDEDRCHAERIGDETGMLSARAAEAVERVCGDVVAALHRDLLDGVRHVFDRHPQEALGRLLGGQRLQPGPFGNVLCHFSELLSHDFTVQRLVRVRPEDVRKMVRVEFAEHDVCSR